MYVNWKLQHWIEQFLFATPTSIRTNFVWPDERGLSRRWNYVTVKVFNTKHQAAILAPYAKPNLGTKLLAMAELSLCYLNVWDWTLNERSVYKICDSEDKLVYIAHLYFSHM